MEKINVLLGEGSATKEKVNRLLDGAIKFYGPKYEQLVLQTVREAIFCEYEKEETVNDILPKVFEASENLKGGRLNLNFSNILKAKKVGACLIVNRTMDGNEQIVITKNTTKRNDYHILAHELFGHAVCGKEKLIVEEDGKIYQRNGISLMEINDNDSRNIYINEGYMELIASQVLKESCIDDTGSQNCGYRMSQYCAMQIMNLLGKDNVIESLVEYQGRLIEESRKDEALMRQIDESLKKLCMLSSSKILFPVKNRLKKKIYTNLNIVQKNLTR